MNHGRGGPMGGRGLPMGGRGGRGPPMPMGGRGFGPGRGGPGRGFGPPMHDDFGGRGRGPMGPMGGPPGRGMGHYGPGGMNQGPHPPPHMMGRGPGGFEGRGNFDGRGGPGRGMGGPPHIHHGRGPPPPPPPGRGPMNHMMQGRGPPPPPPPPRDPRMGGNMIPPPPPPPPQQYPQHHMQMQRMPPPNQHMHPGAPMHPNQPPFHPQPTGQPMRGPPNQPPPFGGQGFPPQQQQMHMNQPPHMDPRLQHQFQQQPPPIQQMQQPPPGMAPQQYPSPNQQPPPQAMPHPHHQPQAIPQQPMAAVGTPTKTTNADAAWTEHKSPAGVPYFYNTVTGLSTYERPAALGGTAVSANATKEASATPGKSKWQTYTDENTGKNYYSDGVTTTWTRPAELPPEYDGGKKQKRPAEEDGGRKPKKKKSDTKDSESLYSSKAEAVAAFKGLLLAKDIAPTTKWADVVRVCSDDIRWEACTTIGERKQALAEYQTKRANELRDVKRQEKVRAKEAYQRLLTDILPTTAKFTPGSSRFMDVRDALSKDDRFYAVEDETTREELFYEWVEELRKKDERNKRNKKREAKEGCLKFLKAKEEEGKLTFASTWSSFVSSLTEDEKSDPRFAISSLMSDSDRQLYFSDYVIELQNTEDEKRRRIRDARRRAEKAQRDVFREKLIELAKEGVVTPDTRWRGIEEKVSSQYPNVFGPVQAQGLEVARELFEDFVYDWKEEYRRDKVTLVRVWDSSTSKKKEFKFDDKKKASVEDFGKLLLESCAGSPDLYGEIRRISNRENPISSIHLFFNELKADAEAAKNGNGKKRGSLLNGDESSEDEGEIIEDGEVAEKEPAAP